MTLRHALPLHVSVPGMLPLPPNQTRLRLELAQLMPIGAPSASLVTLVTHGKFARPFSKGVSTEKPMKLDEGASSTTRTKWSSSGRLSLGIGLAWKNCVASVGATLVQATF